MERTCKTCGETKPFEQFASYGMRNGKLYRAYKCKSCKAAANLKLYHLKPPRIRGKREDYPLQRLRKDIILEKKKEGCSVCGYNEYAFCIDLHHIDPSTKHSKLKNYRSSHFYKLPIPDLIQELKLVTPLCVMCHRKVHAGIIKL